VASKLFIRVVFEFGYLFEFGVFARIVRKASSGLVSWSNIGRPYVCMNIWTRSLRTFPHGISFSVFRHRLSRNRPNRSRFGGAPTRSFDTMRGHACGKEGSGWLEKAALSILSRQGVISPDRHNHPASFYKGSACGRTWAFVELFASFLYRLLRHAFFHCSKNGFVSNFSNNDVRYVCQY